MLQGLEVSEVKFSEMLSARRFDSEYFRPVFINLQKRLETLPHTTLGAKSSFVAGPFGSEFHVENYEELSGFRYIRGKDVKAFFVEDGDNVYIPENDFKRLSEHSVKTDDVLISVVGTLGNACIATGSDLPAIFSCKSTIIRNPEVDPYYLVSFLNSDPGKSLLHRNARGTVQLGLNLPDLRQLPIPLFSKDFQATTKSTINQAHACLIESKIAFALGEQALLSVLGLENWQPPESLTYTHAASDVFATKRLDSEFFHPQNEALKTKVSSLYELRLLSQLGIVTKGQTVPYDENGLVPIIRSGDLADIEDESRFLRALPTEAIFDLERGDVLISSIGFGSIGKVQVFDKSERFGTVSEVTVIRQKHINPYYLCAFFRSIAGQMQIERFITGATGQLHLYPKDVGGFWVPIIPHEQQEEFEHIANSSRMQRNRARSLLEAAKHAVEIAIEENETVALAYLREQENLYAAQPAAGQP